MAELANCSRCEDVFVKGLRDICQKCFRKEEAAFETVYSFLRQRKNREATLVEVVDATGVSESLITKFIREKRLQVSQFQKLAYPCEQCGTNIVSERLCGKCSNSIIQEFTNDNEFDTNNDEKEIVNAYYSFGKDDK